MMEAERKKPVWPPATTPEEKKSDTEGDGEKVEPAKPEEVSEKDAGR